MQGTTKEMGNFYQLVKFIGSASNAKHTLPTEHLSHHMQNEFMQSYADEVLNINLNLLKSNKWLNMIADKVTDCSNNNAMSLLHRACSMKLDVPELLMGLHAVDNIKSDAIVKKNLASAYDSMCKLLIIVFISTREIIGLDYNRS